MSILNVPIARHCPKHVVVVPCAAISLEMSIDAEVPPMTRVIEFPVEQLSPAQEGIQSFLFPIFRMAVEAAG